MSVISFDAATRTWLLRTPRTSYAVRLAPDGTPRHLHWGPPLTLAQAAGLELEEPLELNDSRGLLAGEELPVDGRIRFSVPSLQVRFADATRSIEWAYADHRIDGEELAIRLIDRHYPLEGTLHYRVYPDSDVIERWLTLRHTGDGEPFTILRADSAQWTLPVLDDYRISHVTGHWCGESQLHRVAATHGETVFTSRRGVSSHHANPWVMVDAGQATDTAGEVWSVALAWSGSWRITVSRAQVNRLAITGGFGHDAITWRLRPGQQLTTPAFAGLYTMDGFDSARQAWHAHIAGHVLPRPDELRPVLYNSWEATGFDVNEENQIRLARIAAELGAELFVMDDGWFGARKDDRAGLGDWTPNPDRFPRGLGPLIAEVRRLGMSFGLWVEPEMVNPDSNLYRAHPDWVLHYPNRERTTIRNQLVLNFARPDVQAWAHGWLDQLLRDHDIDFLKWDMNRPFTEAGWPGEDDPDRLWIDHVRGVYSIMDRLRADHPGLRIESCCGGGGRVDLGILRRTDETWPSDNTDAVDRISIQYGYSQIYPARTMAAWVTDSPNFLNGRLVPLRFRFHVAMSGVLGIGGNLTEWSPAELAEAAQLVAQYKRIRPVVQHGTQYWLRSPSVVTPGDGWPGGTAPGGLTAVQYLSPDSAETVVFAWRPTAHFGHPPPPVRLRGLDPAATYRDEDSGREYPGVALAARGVRPTLPPGDYASAILHFRRVSG
ncbi:MAG: alpha-galactosidase [Micromonosporaceae bacterium]|jgi:alpha-galactosidase|nr:alpha-galactosidase [Micromonosporaceae bacterium]